MPQSEQLSVKYRQKIEDVMFQVSKLESFLSLLLEAATENDEANLICVALDITANLKESVSGSNE